MCTLDPHSNNSDAVLLVDDDPNVLEISSTLLIQEGFIVLTAENGDEALGILEKQTPVKLVVTDMKMPGISGLELLKKIRANTCLFR